MLIPVLVAPTAAGKTALALELAAQVPIELISADAMMVYRGMDIGTAKPSLLEQAQLRHHLIDLVNPDEGFSVADWVQLAERSIAEVLQRGNLPFIVGGTGFYIRALSEGLPTVPQADMEVQAPLWQRFETEGLEPLQQELEAFSPEDALRSQRNPRRVIRALEIIRRTGKAPSAFPMTKPAFTYEKLVLLPDMVKLQARIEVRTELMFQQGLVAEVKNLLERYPNLATARQAIGYKEVSSYLQHKLSLEETKAAVSLATVQYAKRQRTWFRKEPEARHLEAFADEVKADILTWLQIIQKDKA